MIRFGSERVLDVLLDAARCGLCLAHSIIDRVLEVIGDRVEVIEGAF